jgi:hypothetical protein
VGVVSGEWILEVKKNVEDSYEKSYYSVPQLFEHLVIFVWIKGCVKFQAMVQVYKKC